MLCSPCLEAHSHPHYRFPIHLVHPVHGKKMVFDPHGLAICPTCRAVWHSRCDNSVVFVAIAA